MKHLSVISMIIGLLALCVLVIWQGIGEVIGLLMNSGWILLTITLMWLPALYFLTESWRLVYRKEVEPPFWYSLAVTWMGRAVNNMLPVATIGGEIAKARLITHRGISGIDATAAMLVDKTVQVLALIFWGLIGVTSLIYLKEDDTFAMIVLVGFVLLSLGLGGFFLVQRAGMFHLLTRIGSKLVKSEKWAEKWDGISYNAQAVDKIVLEIYSNRSRFWWAVFIKTMGLVIQTGEVWLACHLLGFDIGIFEALILKSLTSTVSDVVFIIPNAYGIQEGAYMVIGALLGLSPDFSLAVSLATRIRELVVDIPGLIYWQILEGKTLLKKRIAD